MNPIFVSIIIPVYNVEKYIERCLQSVMNQSYSGEIECIIVDDCTTDGSMDLVQKMLSNYVGKWRFKILNHEQNKGLSEARNTGIRYAKGDYLYFLDSDDVITLDCIEKLAKLAIQYKPDFVIGNVVTIGEEESMDFPLVDNVLLDNNREITQAYSAFRWNMMACNKLINRNFLLHNQLFFYPGIYHEDELWSFQLAACSYKMATCHDVTYLYYQNSSSITKMAFSQRHCEDLFVVIEMCDTMLQNIDNKYLYSRLRALCVGVTCRLAESELPAVFKLDKVRKLKRVVSRKVRYSFPVNGVKDVIKALVLILPAKLVLIYAMILNKLLCQKKNVPL